MLDVFSVDKKYCTLESCLPLLARCLRTFDTRKGLRKSYISGHHKSLYVKKPDLLNELFLLSLNVKNLGFDGVFCNELIDVDRFLLADAINSVDCLTLNTLLKDSDVQQINIILLA